MRGGLIDARLTLAVRLPSRQEGSAVVDPEGRASGWPSRDRPSGYRISSTIERSVKTLSEKGYIPRGYLA